MHLLRTKILETCILLVTGGYFIACNKNNSDDSPASRQVVMEMSFTQSLPHAVSNNGNVISPPTQSDSVYILTGAVTLFAIYEIDIEGNKQTKEIRLPLHQQGTAVSSEKLLVEAGAKMKVSAIVLLDNRDTAIAAVPLKGSVYATWVNNPLPDEFGISASANFIRHYQVVPTRGHSAKEFGYLSFQIDQLSIIERADFTMTATHLGKDGWEGINGAIRLLNTKQEVLFENNKPENGFYKLSLPKKLLNEAISVVFEPAGTYKTASVRNMVTGVSAGSMKKEAKGFMIQLPSGFITQDGKIDIALQ